MKKFFSKAVLALVLVAAQPANAQQTDIYPKPQDIQWGTDVAFRNDIAFTLNGSDAADADAVALFMEKFKTDNGTVQVVIGERGDANITQYESLIPNKAEGYYLSVSNDKVIIAGNDGSGTYYGVQTFIQMTSQPDVMCATVTDYPSVPQRGLVEGYYGNPYSDDNRNSLFEFFGRNKMNVYIYGPKDDKYHRDNWRDPYPEADGQRIKTLAEAAARHKVRFVWAIHPGKDIQWTDADKKASLDKLEKMYALGIRAFAIFFDDINGTEQRKGDGQAAYLNYINENFVKKHTDVAPLIMCPTEYNKNYVGSGSNYLDQLGNNMDKEINIMWTGNGVVDMINRSDMEYINGRIKRNAYIWLNYPVTDYCINHMLMGPTYGNDLDIADMYSGFVSNPMEYAEASKVSLFSIADYTWNSAKYDSNKSWEAALKYIMPENFDAFRFFCENNVDLGATVHGLRLKNESPEFVEAKEIYENKIDSDRTAAYNALGEQFKKFVTTAETLLATDEAPELMSEIEPWLLSMKYLGQKGVSIVEMNNAIVNSSPEDFIESYLRYKAANEAQAALRSRDVEGSLMVATPVVATLHVEPFIKDAASRLISEYKENNNYRIDILPAQILENGTYHIMHNGHYLTNTQPDASKSKPEFKAEVDDTRPQRQEWKITLVPSNNRYKIINLQSDRYLNELGEFKDVPYSDDWNTYEITQLANGKYAIQNAGSSGDKFWTVNNAKIEVGSSNQALPDKYIFDIVPLGGEPNENLIEDGGIYYIMDGKKFYTNNNVNGSAGTPTFNEVATPSKAQEWKISIDKAGKNCYKIVSNADGRYLNELGNFGTNAYYSNWNTYLLTKMGDMWSIRCTQDAGAEYIVLSGDHLEKKNVSNIESYTVSIIAKEDYTSVKNIDTCEMSYNGIEIIAEENAEHMAIYSVDGRLTRENKGNRIATAGIAKGVYIAVATGSNGRSVMRFVAE